MHLHIYDAAKWETAFVGIFSNFANKQIILGSIVKN